MPPLGTCTLPWAHAGTQSTNTRSISPALPTSTERPPQAGPSSLQTKPRSGQPCTSSTPATPVDAKSLTTSMETGGAESGEYRCNNQFEKTLNHWWLWCNLCRGLMKFLDVFAHCWRKKISNHIDCQNLQQNHFKSAMLLPSCAFVLRNVRLCSPRQHTDHPTNPQSALSMADGSVCRKPSLTPVQSQWRCRVLLFSQHCAASCRGSLFAAGCGWTVLP